MDIAEPEPVGAQQRGKGLMPWVGALLRSGVSWRHLLYTMLHFPWALFSFAGIVLVFWISVVPVELTLRWAAYRTVASLVIGAAALAPLLAAEAWSVRETGESDVGGLLLPLGRHET